MRGLVGEMRERILIVEDDPKRISSFQQKFIGTVVDVTDKPETAKDLLTTHNYSKIYLDHDLKIEHYGNNRCSDSETGYAVADFLSRRTELSRDAEIIIHSLSESGSDRMWRKLRETRRYVRKQAFAWAK